MKNFNLNLLTRTNPEPIDPFDDPVGYLAEFGVEAELVHVELDPLESAA